jgi:transcriptional regulator with XRE-family HTH domain
MKNKVLASRIKELRNRNGFSQEELAEKTGLSLRTIQRIENGETEPRGDSLKRIAMTYGVSPDEIADWQIMEDKNVLTMLNLSQLGFLAFPLLGIIIPLAIWIFKKEKIKGVNRLGISILNFQITWTSALCVIYIGSIIRFMLPMRLPISIFGIIGIIALYVTNLLIIAYMTIKHLQDKEIEYKPSFKFLR